MMKQMECSFLNTFDILSSKNYIYNIFSNINSLLLIHFVGDQYSNHWLQF